jgi:hypothetical protein
MTDKPRPGKDKDLRYIRLALEETDNFFRMVGGDVSEGAMTGYLEFSTQAMLLVLDQLDFLDQMLTDATLAPQPVLENNRQLRDLCKTLLRLELTFPERQTLLALIRVLGNQLRALLVVKEIRSGLET